MASTSLKTNQVNFRLDEDALRTVDEAANRFGKTRGEIFLELYRLYFPLWIESEEAKKKVIDEQFAKLRLPADGKSKDAKK